MEQTTSGWVLRSSSREDALTPAPFAIKLFFGTNIANADLKQYRQRLINLSRAAWITFTSLTRSLVLAIRYASFFNFLTTKKICIGFQTRIDLWDEESLELLARAGCVSFECGIESITNEGRRAMNKNCRISTDRITELLIYARQRIPWVQANLIKVVEDDPDQIAVWQANLKADGVWVSEPVPMFPFPGSPEYVTTFGTQPDEWAWERAHRHYLELFTAKGWSDIQEQAPRSLGELEAEDENELTCAS